MICHWEFFWKRWNFLALNFRLLISCCPKKITLWLSLMRIQLHWVEFSEKLYYPIIFCVYTLEIIFELINNQFRIIWGWNYVILKKQNLTIQGHIEKHFTKKKFEDLEVFYREHKSGVIFGLVEIFWRQLWWKTWWKDLFLVECWSIKAMA